MDHAHAPSAQVVDRRLALHCPVARRTAQVELHAGDAAPRVREHEHAHRPRQRGRDGGEEGAIDHEAGGLGVGHHEIETVAIGFTRHRGAILRVARAQAQDRVLADALEGPAAGRRAIHAVDRARVLAGDRDLRHAVGIAHQQLGLGKGERGAECQCRDGEGDRASAHAGPVMEVTPPIRTRGCGRSVVSMRMIHRTSARVTTARATVAPRATSGRNRLTPRYANLYVTTHCPASHC